MYLKNFGVTSKNETYIYALDKTKEKQAPFKTNIRNVCVKTDFYTIDSLPEQHKRILEEFYSINIESYYDEIYNILINPSITKIDKKTRFRIISFCVSQFFRTPKLSTSFNEFWTRLVNMSFDLTKSNPKINKVDFGHKVIDTSTTNREDFIKEETRLNKEMVNKEAVKRIADFTIRRLSDGISVKRIHPNHKLITSDNPVFPSEHIYNPDSFIRVPIDEDHLLMLIPMNEYINEDISRLTYDEEWSFIETTINNIQQLDAAERFILGSESGLQDFIKQYETFDEVNFEQRMNNHLNRMNSLLKYFQGLEKK